MDKALQRLKGYRVLLTLDNGEAVEGQLDGLDPVWAVLTDCTVIAPGGTRLGADGTMFVPLAKIAWLQVP